MHRYRVLEQGKIYKPSSLTVQRAPNTLTETGPKKSILFSGLYIDLNKNVFDGLYNLSIFKGQAANCARALKGWLGEKDRDLSASFGLISSAFSSRLQPSRLKPKRSRFFNQHYGLDLLERIMHLRRTDLPNEVCDNWLMSFVVLRRFIQSANQVFLPYRPLASNTLMNGGKKMPPAILIKNLWGSLGRMESLFNRIDDDLDKSYEHVLFEGESVESFNSQISSKEITDTIAALKGLGFFIPRDFEYYEAKLGKRAIDLIRDFLSS